MRQLRELPKNRPSPLESLPFEIKILVFDNLLDYTSLWSIISASPSFLAAFLPIRNSLLTAATLRELWKRGIVLYYSFLNAAHPDPLVDLDATDIEWIDYKIKSNVENTLTLRSNLHFALRTYFSQLESGSPLRLELRQLKALRTLEDVVMWVNLGPEVRTPRDLCGVPSLCALLSRKTMDSCEDVDNEDVLQHYHSWIMYDRTETEIQTVRSAFVWMNRLRSKRSCDLWDKLEAFQTCFPSWNVTTVSEMNRHKDRMVKIMPLSMTIILYLGQGYNCWIYKRRYRHVGLRR